MNEKTTNNPETVSGKKLNYKSSIFTRIKNHSEALRSNLDGTTHSSEYNIACCGYKNYCCNENEKLLSDVPDIYIYDPKRLVWSQKSYAFLENPYNYDDSDDANGNLRIHPNLWENGASNHLSGVFEVLTDKIYQVRGYDMSNITFVRSNPNEDEIPRWIVMDTLMSNECTEAAISLFNDFLAVKYGAKKDTAKPIQEKDYPFINGYIVGMIISHSHIDHYGGMETVQKYFVDEEKAKAIADKYKGLSRFILAPAGFYDHAVSENVYLGNAMGRRASYQYGSFIKPKYDPDDPENQNVDSYTSGEISIGIGQGQSTGTPSSVGVPTLEIAENTCKQLDGIEVDFQLTPGTEAPAEMNNYIKEYRALWLAENCSGTLHNLYTLRGAEIRDAKAWAKYLMEAAVKYGYITDVIFQSHNWPHWKQGNDKNYIRNFIIETASIYKYIHDQTLLYMNMGYKMNEVADMLVLPRRMQKKWSLKPFYGTPVHNAKAVYQKYLGWYDANPIHLQELPPEQLAKEILRYVQAGSRDKMLSMIKEDIAKGNFWTAAYMSNQMILSGDCDDIADDVTKLCANALLQLGYQCESGTWRNAYLSAAYELSRGKVRTSPSQSNQLAQMPPETLLDYISIFFDGERASSNINCDAYLDVQIMNKTNTAVVGNSYFVFVVKNGTILYHECTKEEYDNGEKQLVISDKDLKSVATGSYKITNDILDDIFADISNAMVVVANNDRFKYFDIIGRHDSQVQFDNKSVDLKTEVVNCIQLLEKYADKFANKETDVVVLSEKDQSIWLDYYKLLKASTHVILDGDFFIPGDETMGIGTDCQFMSYELFYTLYSLYRYLYRSYLKNDYGYKGNNFDEESFAKLKQSIVLFETYVADFYQCKSDSTVKFEKGDYDAFCYLCGKDNAKDELYVYEFFYELYMRYKELSCEINSTGKNLYFEKNNTDTSLKIHNSLHHRLLCNGMELNGVIQNETVIIDVPSECNTVVIEAFYEGDYGMRFITGRLVFHK